MIPTDEQLAVRARGGDSEAFGFLLERTAGMRNGVASRWYAPGFDADDFVQWTGIALWHAVRTFDASHGSLFAPFARMVVGRKLRTLVTYARQPNQSPLSDAVRFEHHHATETEDIGLAETLADRRSHDPHTALTLKEDLAVVTQVIADLPARQRAVVLGLINGASYLEIADRIGQPGSRRQRSKAVDNALQLARGKVLRALEEAA